MPRQLPFVSCLCPTFRRPRLLANSLACFLAQDYPANRRELIILDDGGDFSRHTGDGWRLVAAPGRFPSLPDKFNTLAKLAGGDILVVWEDDDIYLPWHITAHVEALGNTGHSKPSRILSNCSGVFLEEDATGRFHASLALTRHALVEAGGWPRTSRADFDQQLMSRLEQTSVQGDPCRSHRPSYAFRWGSTGDYHGQGVMRGPDDTTWYHRIAGDASAAGESTSRLAPRMDDETAALFAAAAHDSAKRRAATVSPRRPG